jgi:hypothetical protein
MPKNASIFHLPFFIFLEKKFEDSGKEFFLFFDWQTQNSFFAIFDNSFVNVVFLFLKKEQHNFKNLFENCFCTMTLDDNCMKTSHRG